MRIDTKLFTHCDNRIFDWIRLIKFLSISFWIPNWLFINNATEYIGRCHQVSKTSGYTKIYQVNLDGAERYGISCRNRTKFTMFLIVQKWNGKYINLVGFTHGKSKQTNKQTHQIGSMRVCVPSFLFMHAHWNDCEQIIFAWVRVRDARVCMNEHNWARHPFFLPFLLCHFISVAHSSIISVLCDVTSAYYYARTSVWILFVLIV